MANGWVKLWRKSLDSGLLQDPELWTFWCWCLMKAVHRPQQTIINKQVVDLQPGQFIFGRKKAAAELPLSEKKVRTCLYKLEKLQNLAIQSASRYSIITIINWESYQQSDQPTGQPTGQPKASQRPAKGQPKATSGEGEEGEEGGEGTVRITNSATAPLSNSNGVPLQQIMEAWNQALEENESPLPKVKQIKQGTQRQKHIKARWKEHPDLETWKTVIQKAAFSDFLNGRSPGSQWQASFDWIVKSPDNFLKVLEGKYDNRDPYGNTNKCPI